MTQTNLEEKIKSAEKHKSFLFDKSLFDELSLHNTNTRDLLTDMISGFLGKYGITDKFNSKKIPAIPKEDILLLDSVYSLAKEVVEIAAIGYNHINPLPLLENAFRAVEPTDRHYAAQFLGRLGDLVNKDEKFPTRMKVILEEVLPAQEEKKSNLEEYQKALDNAVKYAETVIFCGIGYASLHDFNKFIQNGSGTNGKAIEEHSHNKDGNNLDGDSQTILRFFEQYGGKKSSEKAKEMMGEGRILVGINVSNTDNLSDRRVSLYFGKEYSAEKVIKVETPNYINGFYKNIEALCQIAKKNSDAPQHLLYMTINTLGAIHKHLT